MNSASNPQDNRSIWLVTMSLLFLVMLTPSRAFGDGVVVQGEFQNCGGAPGFTNGSGGPVTGNETVTQPFGSVSESGNVNGGSLSVSASSAAQSACFVQAAADFSLQGEVFLSGGVTTATVGLRDTGFSESDNCAAVGCGNGSFAGQPSVVVEWEIAIENLLTGTSSDVHCNGNVVGGFFGLFGTCIQTSVAIGVRGDPILISGSLDVQAVNGAFISVSDPLELVLPPGATFVPDNPAITFPTVTSTVPEPSTVTLFGVGLVSLLVGLLKLQRAG